MNRRFNSTQRNYIIIGLCAILVIMGVGYAAFSSQLKITGTSKIDSNWNIQITGIDTILPSQMGNADIPEGYNKTEPTYTPTTATFNAGFELPGSMIGYMVEVSNLGSIDGYVTIGNLNCGSNDAIECEVAEYNKKPFENNITSNDVFVFENGNQDYSKINFPLKVNEKHYIIIAVGYADVEEQPTNLSANISLELTYEQYVDTISPLPSGETTLIGGQNVDIMKYGDGLYKDEYENGRYIYKGANPNNYISFNNDLWKIISKEADGTYKIVNVIQKDIRFDDDSNDWETSEVMTTLNNDYYNTIDSNSQKYIVDHTFYTGAVTTDIATTINNVVTEEKSSTWIGKIGLINVSDYMKIYLDNEIVEGDSTIWGWEGNNIGLRAANSYLTNLTYGPYEYNWTINPKKGSSNEAIMIYESYDVGSALISNLCTFESKLEGSLGYLNNNGLTVSLYLSSNITLSGTGSEEDPYIIV